MSSVRQRRSVLIQDCAACPVGSLAVCQPFFPDRLDVTRRLRQGDRTLPPGFMLLEEGEAYEDLYNLVDGWVAVYDIDCSGTRRIHDVLLPGSFLGYQPSVTAPSQFSYQTLSRSAVCAFRRTDFHAALLDYPEMAHALLRKLCDERRRALKRLSQMSKRSARSRTAFFLYDLYTRAVRDAPAYVRGSKLLIPMTQEQIADAVFMTSIYLNRHLREFKALGILDYAGREYDLDVDALREIANA